LVPLLELEEREDEDEASFITPLPILLAIPNPAPDPGRCSLDPPKGRVICSDFPPTAFAAAPLPNPLLLGAAIRAEGSTDTEDFGNGSLPPLPPKDVGVTEVDAWLVLFTIAAAFPPPKDTSPLLLWLLLLLLLLLLLPLVLLLLIFFILFSSRFSSCARFVSPIASMPKILDLTLKDRSPKLPPLLPLLLKGVWFTLFLFPILSVSVQLLPSSGLSVSCFWTFQLDSSGMERLRSDGDDTE